MSELSMNWLFTGTRGKACNHDSVYTKQNRKTGKSYAVKLCNPSTADPSDAQTNQRSIFGKISKALTIWIANGSDEGSDEYCWVMKQFKAQTKYATLRGYMMAKNMAVANTTDSKVVVTVNGKATTIDVASGTSSTGGTV